MVEKNSSNHGYKTLKDFAKILELFSFMRVNELSVSEISRSFKISPSKVSRMLRTMEEEGYFERNTQTKKYSLGIRFFELGIIYASNSPLHKIIRPHLEEMAKGTNLTASWGILRNCRVIVIDRIQNLNIDLLAQRIGLDIPVHSTSLGKILMSYLPEEEQDNILTSTELKRFTPATIIDRELIKEDLRICKQRGYATDREETHEDLNGIAAPVRNRKGEVVAAINLMADGFGMAPDRLFVHTEYLRKRAVFISRQLGYSPM